MPTRRSLLTAALLLLALSFTNCTHPTPEKSSAPHTLRVLTYNIHHAEGTDGKLDIPRIAAVIRESKADLAAIQELDLNTKRVPQDTPAELARLTGLHAVFRKAIDYQGGAYGQVILSRFPPQDPQVRILPGTPNRETRIAVSVRVHPVGLPALRFVTTHLDHQLNDDRVRQAHDLITWLFPDDTRTLLAGDLNATPDSRPLAILKQCFTDTAGPNAAPTIPSENPKHRIDYVLTDNAHHWRVISSQVLDEPVASDHRPVLVELAP